MRVEMSTAAHHARKDIELSNTNNKKEYFSNNFIRYTQDPKHQSNAGARS
ncbi:hypothetical protein MIDIC_520001 [Alphaproteobacteria bacterium]